MDNAVMEQESNVVDVTEQVTANNQQQEEKRDASRWGKDNHVFAEGHPHPAHELIPNQTAYGRDMTDEDGNVISKTPEGFTRIILPNLIPTEMLERATELCKMHKVDIRDEWRYAWLEITKSLITELEKREVPKDYKPEKNYRLTPEQKEAAKAAAELLKKAKEQAKEEGKKLREQLAEQRKKATEQYKQKLAEIRGIKLPENESSNGTKEAIYVPAENPAPEAVEAVPAPAPAGKGKK